jgi:hypothetical protein
LLLAPGHYQTISGSFSSISSGTLSATSVGLATTNLTQAIATLGGYVANSVLNVQLKVVGLKLYAFVHPVSSMGSLADTMQVFEIDLTTWASKKI